MKKLIPSIILIVFLCGCSAQTQNTPVNSGNAEPVASEPIDSEPAASAPVAAPSGAHTAEEAPSRANETPTQTEETPLQADATPTFAFDAPITDGLPAFKFEVSGTEIKDHELVSYEYTVRISCDELSEQQPQTVKIESSERWTEENRKLYIDLIDIDFDGYADIQAFTSSGTVNVNYAFYRFNVFLGQGYGEYEETPFFELLTTGFELYPDTKQIISASRDSAVNHPREMYQLADTQRGGWLGEYQLVRREEQELSSDNEIAVRIFYGDEEIYAETVPLEGDGYTASGSLDNYLRFGIGDSISIEKAANMLYTKYGETDGETGYALAFMIEDMVIFERLSCYKFRMQWLVDGNHWSTIGFVAVAPDGRIIEQVE